MPSSGCARGCSTLRRTLLSTLLVSQRRAECAPPAPLGVTCGGDPGGWRPLAVAIAAPKRSSRPNRWHPVVAGLHDALQTTTRWRDDHGEQPAGADLPHTTEPRAIESAPTPSADDRGPLRPRGRRRGLHIGERIVDRGLGRRCEADPGPRRVHARGHGVVERTDLPVPRHGRQVPRRLRPRAHERLPRPDDHRQARRGERGGTEAGDHLVLRDAARRPELSLATATGCACCVGPDRQQRDPAAGVARPHGGLHVRLPRPRRRRCCTTSAPGRDRPERRRPPSTTWRSRSTSRPARPVIGPPSGATTGCAQRVLPARLPHRTSMASLNGKLINGQRFAIDWKRTNDKGFMRR